MSKDTNRLTGIKQPSESQSIPTGIYPPGPFAPSGVFSIDAHENLIRSKGFKAYHYRHALNPKRNTVAEGVNLKEMDMTGLVYYDAHELYVAPQNLSWDETYLVHGIHGKHTMTVNHTGRYIDEEGKRVFLRSGDLIILKDSATSTVMMEDLFAYDPTGIQSLRFPVFAVDYMYDGNKRYEEGVDFNVIDGKIHWTYPTGQARPTFDPIKNQGTVFSCVYWTRPFFVVVDTPRIFRMAWANDIAYAGAPAEATYYPGSAILAMAWLIPSAKFDNIVWPKD